MSGGSPQHGRPLLILTALVLVLLLLGVATPAVLMGVDLLGDPDEGLLDPLPGGGRGVRHLHPPLPAAGGRLEDTPGGGAAAGLSGCGELVRGASQSLVGRAGGVPVGGGVRQGEGGAILRLGHLRLD